MSRTHCSIFFLLCLASLAVIPASTSAESSRGMNIDALRLTPEGIKLPRLWAVVIGINQYQHPDMRDLAAASADARRFAAFLESQRDSGFYADAHIVTLIDRDATRERILAEWDSLGDAESDDIVIIFFAGHGLKEQRRGVSCLAPVNVDPANPFGTAIRISDVSDVLAGIHSRRKILIADACHSAGIGWNLRATGDDLWKGLRANAIFAAARSDETSREDDSLGHGLFTDALVRGLEGSADQDSNGIITLGEIEDFVRQDVMRRTSTKSGAAAQHPTLIGDFDGGLPLAVTSKRALDQLRSVVGMNIKTENSLPPSTIRPPAATTPRRATVTVTSEPSGATVYLDGEEAGVTPLPIPNVEFGVVSVMVAAPGYSPRTEDVTVDKQNVGVKMRLRKQTGGAELSVVNAIGKPVANIEITIGRDVAGKTGPDGKLTVSDLASKRYTVTAQSDEYDPASIALNVPITGIARATIKVNPLPGKILVTTTPAGAEIFLDGVSKGIATGPLTIRDVAAGQHTIKTSLTGYDSQEKQVTIVPKRTTALALELNDSTTLFPKSAVMSGKSIGTRAFIMRSGQTQDTQIGTAISDYLISHWKATRRIETDETRADNFIQGQYWSREHEVIVRADIFAGMRILKSCQWRVGRNELSFLLPAYAFYSRMCKEIDEIIGLR